MAKTGQALDDWIKVEKSLPPTQAQCPWDTKSSDICYVPPTVTNANSNNKNNTGNNQAWKPLRKPNPPPGWGSSPQPAEPVKSPWGAPARTDAPAPWAAPAPTSGAPAPWDAKRARQPGSPPTEPPSRAWQAARAARAGGRGVRSDRHANTRCAVVTGCGLGHCCVPPSCLLPRLQTCVCCYLW